MALRSDDRLVTRLLQFPMLASAHEVDRVVKFRGGMEPVMYYGSPGCNLPGGLCVMSRMSIAAAQMPGCRTGEIVTENVSVTPRCAQRDTEHPSPADIVQHAEKVSWCRPKLFSSSPYASEAIEGTAVEFPGDRPLHDPAGLALLRN